MNKDYLSFDSFEEQDLKEFLKEFPKELLSVPISRKKQYIKEVGIKGFRPDSYQFSAIERIYIKEIIQKKGNSYLEKCLLTIVDKKIKKDLNNYEYKLLSEKEYTSDQLEEILNILFDKKSINSKYLLMLLGLSEEQNKKYTNMSYDKKIEDLCMKIKEKDDEIKQLKNEVIDIDKNKKIIVNKLKKDNETLLIDNRNIKNENENLKKEIINLNKENNILKENTTSRDKIIKEIFDDLSGIEGKTVNNLYKDLNLKSIDDYISIIYEKKMDLLNNNDFETIGNLIFIEYILTKLKEIENNGE